MPFDAKPAPETPCPPTIMQWADAHHYEVAELVWQNSTGAITTKLVRDGHPDVFAKHCDDDPIDEAERLSWLHGRFSCPAIVDYAELDGGFVLATMALPGCSTAFDRRCDEPRRVATAVGEGLARLHSLNPTQCFFGPPQWISDDVGDHVVVLHGDPVVSNTLLTDDGAFAGFVGVGQLGPGDPWADLAVASSSLTNQFGLDAGRELFASYGVQPDEDRCQHYLSQRER